MKLSFNNKKILTVYDLSWIFYPEFHPKKRVVFMEKYFEKDEIEEEQVSRSMNAFTMNKKNKDLLS